MLEANYTPRPPRIEVKDATAKVGRVDSRRLTLHEGASADADRIVDLNTKGLKLIVAGEPPELESLLEIELRHPQLRGPLRLQGRVKWARDDEEGQTSVGVAFEQLRDTTRVALMQIVVLELGSSVYGPQGQLGFVAPNDEDDPPRYFVYDLRRHRIGTVFHRPTGYELDASTGGGGEFVTLGEALHELFGAGPLRIVPPLK